MIPHFVTAPFYFIHYLSYEILFTLPLHNILL